MGYIYNGMQELHAVETLFMAWLMWKITLGKKNMNQQNYLLMTSELLSKADRNAS